MTRKIRRKRHVTKTWKKLRQTGGLTFPVVATVIQFLTRIGPLRSKRSKALFDVILAVSAADAAVRVASADAEMIKRFNELDLNVNTSELVLINTTDRLAKGLNNIFGTQSWNLTYIPAAIEAQPDYDTKIETKDSLSLEEELIVFEKPPTEPAQQDMDTKILHLIEKWENIEVEFYKMVTDYEIGLVRQPTLQTMGSRTLPFQMLNIGDVVAATIVRERMSLDHTRYPLITPDIIDNIINNFKKKMRVSVGTQLAIAYAVKNFVPPTDPPVPPVQTGPQPRPTPGLQPGHPFQYLENLIGLLKHAVYIINNKFDNIWDQKKTSDQFLVSGGNVFFLLAGVLDWFISLILDDCQMDRDDYFVDRIDSEHLPNLRAIWKKIQAKLEIEHLRTFICKIRESQELIRSILSSLSDMDFVFLTLNKNYMNWKSVPMKSVIQITGQLLRTIMNTTNQLFPFITRGLAKGRTYNNSSSLDTRKLTGMVLDGLRQTCSDIEELRISLHRIKQQIHIVGLYGLGRRTELVFGEGIDLVIASKDTPIFPYKQRAYEKVWLLEKTPRGYYSTDVFLHELDEILKSPKDGKTAKRTQRRDFLNMLRSPNPNAADIILWAIFEHIHE